MKIFVLYSELAGYTMACMRRYAEVYGGEMHIVRWPVNPEAPFNFDGIPGVTYYERNDYDAKGLIALGERIQPDVVYSAGWIDKAYLRVARHFYRQGLPVIAAFDTQWKGLFKQKIATVLSPFLFRRSFTHCWVPGLFQYEYARRLGFPRERILTGMYSADVKLFEAVYAPSQAQKEIAYPHRFIYVGRYLALKGVRELYHAFREMSAEVEHDWELVLIGNGPLKAELAPQPNIVFRDFVQPTELPQLAFAAGAFVLPSRTDAWGVVLHEFAAAGLPLISTDAAGAITAFVREGYNGFLHRRGSKDSLKAVLKKVIALSDPELRTMSQRSHELSKQISPDTWAATLHKVAVGE
ncbi:MAG: glycosyltransferase family 4 protein [Bacteroidota bacterium]